MIISILMILMTFSQTANEQCELPTALKQVLAKSNVNLTLVQTNQLIPDWKYFVKEGSCPTLVKGDFNGDGRTDYCGLMNSDPLEIMIFEATENSYKIISFQKIGYGIYDIGIGLGMSLEEPKKILGTTESITLKNQGITFEKFESSAFVIYYEDGEYKKIWTGD